MEIIVFTHEQIGTFLNNANVKDITRFIKYFLSEKGSETSHGERRKSY